MDDREAQNNFWSIEGKYTYRHHVEPGVQLYVLKEESYPIPLRNTDVVRRTNTTLDVLLESRSDDYWNFAGEWSRSEPWTAFTQFTVITEKSPDGEISSGSG